MTYNIFALDERKGMRRCIFKYQLSMAVDDTFGKGGGGGAKLEKVVELKIFMGDKLEFRNFKNIK